MKKVVAINCSPGQPGTQQPSSGKPKRVLKHYQGNLGTFGGPTKILLSSDTLQVKDYSRYHRRIFDPRI